MKNGRTFPAHLRLLATLLLLLPGAALRAEPSDDEQRALHDAEQSLHEGAFDLADSRAATLLKKFPKSELVAAAQLIEAEARYQLGRSDAALAALALADDQVPAALRADYFYWQAESLQDLGRWHDGELKFRALLAEKGAHADEANLGLAWALFKQGKAADAGPIIADLTKNHGSSEAGQEAQLLAAKMQLASQDNAAAIAGLETLLAASPAKGVGFEAAYWLGEGYTATHALEKAVAAYEKVTGDAQAFPRRLVAQAWLGLGRAQRGLQQNDQAMLAYEQTYHLSENPAAQLEAFRAYLDCARDSGVLADAVAKLQEFAKTSDTSAPEALLAIGTALADSHDDDRAIGVLESLLVAYPASTSIPAANDELGALYARAGRTAQAVRALNACITANSDPALVRHARFELGYVLLNQTHDYGAAATQFSQIADGADAASESASYNYLLAEAALGKADVFLKAEVDFEKRFPKSTYLKPLALAGGRLLASAGRTDEAKALYQKAAVGGGATPEQEELLKALDDLQYQTNDLEGTLATCKLIVDQFPADGFAAAQRGVLVSYELGRLNEGQVEDALVKLAQKYKDLPSAPDAYFRLGEFYMNHQDYVRAQDAFQQLATNYPNSDQVSTAYYCAGRAAFAHQDFSSALTLLEKVPDAAPFKPEARLWEGRVYQQLQNFTQALTFYNEVLTTEKEGPLFVQASLLKGQCYFAQGGQDAGNYSLALTPFEDVLKGKDGTISERNQAAVMRAKTLEKLNRADEALGQYLDVVYGKVAGDDSAAPQPPEFSWQLEAGSQAGRILEGRKDWRGAIAVYKRLEDIGGAHAQDFHDLINKLRRDNYIYE
jgi:tetratricopeptide (TPR) repeat protein